jgi:glycosyltransferase involved in cell wall biosynthesis
MIAYNHEPFIAQAIEGILMQKTDFPIELIIGEDCSTDKTREICIEYQNKYPAIIKLQLPDTNKGMQRNFVENMQAASGKYIALCEGDDYWTDPLKLQRQIDFLEANKDVSLSAENGLVKNSISDKEYLFNKESKEQYYTAYQMLQNRRFPTASTVFRAEYVEDIAKLLYCADSILWVLLSTKGRVHYNPVVSSVYNRGMQGIVKGSDRLKWLKTMENWDKQIMEIIKTSSLKDSFNYRIFTKRRHKEFWSAYKHYHYKNDAKIKMSCLLECFKINPARTLRMLLLFK